MTGKLIYTNQNTSAYIHCLLYFSDSTFLFYQDRERFGSIDIYSKAKHSNYLTIPLFSNLGIEPLSKDFTFNSFKGLLIIQKTLNHF